LVKAEVAEAIRNASLSFANIEVCTMSQFANKAGHFQGNSRTFIVGDFSEKGNLHNLATKLGEVRVGNTNLSQQKLRSLLAEQ
jgi:hypothetical protein